ncbi:CDIF630_02480 family spore surface protein [Wansuia hejianensis]|nr:DUF3787 domain-containing protein [Wansuia hejianensis]
MTDKKKDLKENDLGLYCVPTNDMKKFNDKKFEPVDVPSQGTYKAHKEPKRENTATDVYYKTECKLPESEVAIPTYDSVVEAKEWVDDENKK